MPFVVTDGQLTQLQRPALPIVPTSVRLSDTVTQAYDFIYRTQPQVRTVVSFLARNIAHIGLHVFRRVSDTDRVRLTDHPFAALIARPLADRLTRYRLMERLVSDVAIFDQAWLVKLTLGGTTAGLLPVPVGRIKPDADSWLGAGSYTLVGDRGKRTLSADQVVDIHGYHPGDLRVGCSPMEALRSLLVEEFEAGRHRQQMWRNGARMSGVITRPADAPDWSDKARKRFQASWRAAYSGDGPDAGGTPLLEDGMTYTPAGLTADQAQYIEARRLTREEVAAAYHVPLPMVGILDHATFSNIREQHRNLYQDTLGPWLQLLQEELQLQLLPDFDDDVDVYCEFNIAAKMAGSFEEQASAASTSTGRPWMTVNETRARFNLPRVDGGDELVTPLNVLVGGLASPRDTAPEPEAAGPKALPGRGRSVAVKARAPQTVDESATAVLARFFERQGQAVASKLGASKAAGGKAALDEVWDGPRWDRELGVDLLRVNVLAAGAAATATMEALGAEPDAFDETLVLGWLTANAAGVARGVNAATAAAVGVALVADDPVAAVGALFATYVAQRAAAVARAQTSAMSGFGSVEAAKQATGGQATKTWRTGKNPRKSHQRMDGETVDLDGVFSNGARWPADTSLSEDERAGCNCELIITAG